MATNLVRDGLCFLAAVPSGTVSGSPVLVNGIPGVALTDRNTAGYATVDITPHKVWQLSVKGIDDAGNSAVVEGNRIYHVAADTPVLAKKRNAGSFWGIALAGTPGGATTLVSSGATTTINVLCVGAPAAIAQMLDPLKDDNGNEVLDLAGVTSAVNQVKITNAATGNAPSVAADGEANVGLTVAAKGTGTVTVGQATGSVQLATVGTDKIGFYGTAPATQPAHVTDPASAVAITAVAPAAVTSHAITDSSTGTPSTTEIAEITGSANAGSADLAPVENAIATLAAELALVKADLAATRAEVVKLVTDVGAVRTGSEANNTAIDSLLAQHATLGLQASV